MNYQCERCGKELKEEECVSVILADGCAGTKSDEPWYQECSEVETYE